MYITNYNTIINTSSSCGKNKTRCGRKNLTYWSKQQLVLTKFRIKNKTEVEKDKNLTDSKGRTFDLILTHCAILGETCLYS